MKETLSAWMDSELNEQQASALLPQLKRDEQLRRNWDCYHLIGDALRGVEGADLCAGIRARLDAEPTVLAPQRRSKPEKLRWAALSAAASVAAVAFVGWMALPGTQQDSLQLAAVPAPKVQQVAVPAGEGAKNYLFAHQRYSPSSAMQGVAPYVRTVAERRSSPSR
ncbi:MAG: sigma-E factor negative regulatory protein [Burkholderiales bacterium]